jgi:hypothetical protein
MDTTSEYKKLSEKNDIDRFLLHSPYYFAGEIPHFLAELLRPNNESVHLHVAAQLRGRMNQMARNGEILLYDQDSHLQVDDADILSRITDDDYLWYSITADGLIKFAALIGITFQYEPSPIDIPPELADNSINQRLATPVKRQIQQEDEILRIIRDVLKADPLKLPAYKLKLGKKGIKAEVRSKLNWQGTIFNKAWDRLREKNLLKYSE